MTIEVQMRPECAMEFGKITAERETAGEFRDEVRGSLLAIQKEIHLLTGNGNRGKIDVLHVKISELAGMLQEHVAHSKGRDDRLAAVEGKQEELDSRLWSLGMKLGVTIGTITVLSQLAMKLF